MDQHADPVQRALAKLSVDWSAERYAAQVTPSNIAQLVEAWNSGRLDAFAKVRLLLACLLAVGRAGTAAAAGRAAAAGATTTNSSSREADGALAEAMQKLSQQARGDDDEWVRVMGAAAGGSSGRLDLQAMLKMSEVVRSTVAEIGALLAEGQYSKSILPPLETKYLQQLPEPLPLPPPKQHFVPRANAALQPLSESAACQLPPVAEDSSGMLGSPGRTGSISLQARRGVLGTTGATDLFIPHKQPQGLARSTSITEAHHPATTTAHGAAGAASGTAHRAGKMLVLSESEGKLLGTKTSAKLPRTSSITNPRRSSAGGGSTHAGEDGSAPPAAAAAAAAAVPRRRLSISGAGAPPNREPADGGGAAPDAEAADGVAVHGAAAHDAAAHDAAPAPGPQAAHAFASPARRQQHRELAFTVRDDEVEGEGRQSGAGAMTQVEINQQPEQEQRQHQQDQQRQQQVFADEGQEGRQATHQASGSDSEGSPFVQPPKRRRLVQRAALAAADSTGHGADAVASDLEDF